jgi:IS5 family transposase
MPLKTMLRVHFVQNWHALSDPLAEETLYDSEATRRFAGIELGDDCIPDKTTILNFRHLLERHCLTEAIFAGVRQCVGCHAQGAQERFSDRGFVKG